MLRLGECACAAHCVRAEILARSSIRHLGRAHSNVASCSVCSLLAKLRFLFSLVSRRFGSYYIYMATSTSSTPTSIYLPGGICREFPATDFSAQPRLWDWPLGPPARFLAPAAWRHPHHPFFPAKAASPLLPFRLLVAVSLFLFARFKKGRGWLLNI